MIRQLLLALEVVPFKGRTSLGKSLSHPCFATSDSLKGQILWPFFRANLAFSSRPLVRVPCKRGIMVQNRENR